MVQEPGPMSALCSLSGEYTSKGVVITTSGHCYDKDLLAKYAPQIEAGHTRSFDTPMEEGCTLSTVDSPTLDSEEWTAMGENS